MDGMVPSPPPRRHPGKRERGPVMVGMVVFGIPDDDDDDAVYPSVPVPPARLLPFRPFVPVPPTRSRSVRPFSGRFRKCFWNISGMSRGSFGNVSGMFRGCLGDASRTLEERLGNVSGNARDETWQHKADGTEGNKTAQSDNY